MYDFYFYTNIIIYLSESSKILHDVVDDRVALRFPSGVKYQNTNEGSSRQLDMRQRSVTADPDLT